MDPCPACYLRSRLARAEVLLATAKMRLSWYAAELRGRVVDDGPDYAPIRVPHPKKAADIESLHSEIGAFLAGEDG